MLRKTFGYLLRVGDDVLSIQHHPGSWRKADGGVLLLQAVQNGAACVPYGKSCLTRLLADCMGYARSRVVLIATLRYGPHAFGRTNCLPLNEGSSSVSIEHFHMASAVATQTVGCKAGG